MLILFQRTKLVVSLFGLLIVFGNCTSEQNNIKSKAEIPASESDVRKIEISNAIQDLIKIPLSLENKIDEDKAKIKHIVDKFNNPRDILTFALICRHLSSHCQNIECFKGSNLRPTFEIAYWQSVKKLAIDKTTNKEELNELKEKSFLKGTDVGDWEKIVNGIDFP